VADAAGDRVNTALGPPVTFGRPVAGATVVGVQATRGVQNNAAVQAHAGGAVDAHVVTQPNAHVVTQPNAHVVTQPADHAIVAHGALTEASPVVAAVPSKVDADTITLDVNTTLGDILTLIYEARGARVVP